MATTDLFSGAPEEQGYTEERAPGTRVRDAPQRVQRLGKILPEMDSRKWGNFDMARGQQQDVPYQISRDDRMSPGDAKKVMDGIMEMFGLSHATEGQQLAFYRGLFFHHAIEGSSTLQPGRAIIVIQGSEFKFSEIVTKLGVDHRRFFRAYADEVRAEVKRVLENYDPGDFYSRECVAWIKQKAMDRGITRHPDLIADSASACTDLGLAELAAVNKSTQYVLSSTVNAVDPMRARNKALTADQYDSTNMTTIANASMDQGSRA